MSAFRVAILLCLAGALCGGCANRSRQKVAQVLNRPIFADEITPTPEELAALHNPDAAPEEELREERRARITTRIIRPLEARYVRQRGLQATESEIEQFIKGSRERSEQIERKLRADLQDQRAKLTAASTLEEEEDAAALRIEAIEALLALRDAEERRRELLDDQERTTSDEYEAHSERELAAVWVATWKFHRALYHEFGGGAVAWRQSGPEPIGAYRKWLEALESAGDFIIRDPDLRELFWSYWRAGTDVVDPHHDPFETPWWLAPASQPAAAQSSR